MKRDGFGDYGPAYKRQRQSGSGEEVTFLIPSKAAGSIIGKGGTNISKLRNQVLFRLKLPNKQRELSNKLNCSKPAHNYQECPKVLTIVASDLETTMDVLKEIIPNLADGGAKTSNDEMDVRMLIHQSRAGCVIGKAGAKIKELREKTGARLKIFANTAPQSTERVVQLIGEPEQVVAGVREVLQLIRQVPMKGSSQNYDPHNYDDYFADEYGGYGAGQMTGGRGGRGAGGAGPGGARGGRPPPPPMPHMGPPARGGLMSGGGRQRGPRPFDFPPRAPLPPRGAPRPPPPHNFPPPSNQEDSTTQVTIPKDLAGAIIGKAGSRIRKIRASSGAAIDIAEAAPGAPDRVISISGSPHAIQMAQYLLQQSVHESHPNLTRGNF